MTRAYTPRGSAPSKRLCPKCGDKKDYYAKTCRSCQERPKGFPGVRGPAHPAWKGGTMVDGDGYLKRYDPDHPWPRKGGYVLEHVRVMELAIGRRITTGECVHHKDHDRQNNRLENLELMTWSEHSKRHRADDAHTRTRDSRGRFAAEVRDA